MAEVKYHATQSHDLRKFLLMMRITAFRKILQLHFHYIMPHIQLWYNK